MLKENLRKLSKAIVAATICCSFVLATPARAKVESYSASEKQKTAFSSFNPQSDKQTDDTALLPPGEDGNFTATGLNQQVNSYGVLSQNAAAGDTSFSVTNIFDLSLDFGPLLDRPVAQGDLLLLIQMQGADINTTDTVNYGSVTTLNNAGLYEFVTVNSVNILTNTITINTISSGNGCTAGLRNNYSTIGETQVVRVPQFNNLTIPTGTSLSPAPWNGARGGVFAVEVLGVMTVDGAVDANGRGFRGGQVENATLNPPGSVIYRSTSANDGAEKGEGIAGSQSDYDGLGGRYGRGAPANGGGGGNAHNAAGGGGANGNNGNTWNGQGVMPAGVTGASAWTLDPGYINNIPANTLTTSAGGGRGGYTWSANDADALTQGPGNGVWGGDSRREVGGLGGRPVDNDPATRVFLGGGGGAGDANNGVGGAGGTGGGIVVISGRNVTGSGSINVNGQDGFSSSPAASNDAPGGGGAGGTVVISVVNLGGISVSANGGLGGNNVVPAGNTEAEGNGGGGGGGFIAIRSGQTIARSAAGAAGGTSNSLSVTEFPRNGATDGQTGQPAATAITIPSCRVATAAQVSVVGRVTTATGRGISNAQLSLTNSRGETKYAVTNPFGYFRFEEITANESVIVTVKSKRYRFENPTQLVFANNTVNEVNFVALP